MRFQLQFRRFKKYTAKWYVFVYIRWKMLQISKRFSWTLLRCDRNWCAQYAHQFYQNNIKSCIDILDSICTFSVSKWHIRCMDSHNKKSSIFLEYTEMFNEGRKLLKDGFQLPSDVSYVLCLFEFYWHAKSQYEFADEIKKQVKIIYSHKQYQFTL